MRIQFSLIALGIAISPALLAQSNGWETGGQALGRTLSAGDRDDAYQRGVERAAQLSYARDAARIAQSNQRIAAAETRTQGVLKDAWMQAGLSDTEANAVAQTFRLREEQLAINTRAQREGVKATVDAALAAYQRYEYLLANQLLNAALLLPTEQPANAE